MYDIIAFTYVCAILLFAIALLPGQKTCLLLYIYKHVYRVRPI